MSGLDKIISQIQGEADGAAAKILQEAKEKADGIRDESAAAVLRINQETEKKCVSAREDILKKGRSAAKMQCQRELLSARQQIISETVEAAKTSILNLDAKEYFALIRRLLQKHVRAEEGTIRFNKKDLGRLPAGFEKELASIAKEKGGSLALDSTPCAIGGGFVLVYGGVEENCSFDSVFSDAKEQIQDKLHGLLFAQ